MTEIAVVADSPFRKIDARTKLFVGLAFACFAVPFASGSLYVLLAAVVATLIWGRLVGPSCRLLKRLVLPLAVLCALSAWVKDVETAAVLAARILSAVLSFCIVLFSTRPDELAVALRQFGLPPRHAHCALLLVEQVPIVVQELSQLRETYQQRWGERRDDQRRLARLRSVLRMARRVMAPAAVLSIHRAWASAEAAYARGFETRSFTLFRECRLTWRDALFAVVAAAVVSAGFWMR